MFVNQNYNNRTFQSPDSMITGQSVVLDSNPVCSAFPGEISPNPWPYGLSDYLQSFIGKRIQIKYILANGRCCEKRGILMVAGSNFIGLQPDAAEDLFMIELSLIKCVSVLNYKKGPPRRIR